MSIEVVPVRATVELNGLKIKTPYVLSFSVRKARGQVSTFDASLKVSHDDMNGFVAGGNVVISAGVKGSEKKIFTGIVTQAKIEPCHDDPIYVILSISGKDVLMLLEGKKFTRRCRATKGAFCTITGVGRRGLKSGKWAFDLNTITMDTGRPAELGKTGTSISMPSAAKVVTNSDAPVPKLSTQDIQPISAG